jgi:hypothetical protein
MGLEMKSDKPAIEVQVVVRDKKCSEVPLELLQLLQELADEWYNSQFPTIPCGYVSRDWK